MRTIRLSPETEQKTHCYHCGDECGSHPVEADGHVFCCDGCRLVYDLLKENNLCNYYDLSRAPGHAAEDSGVRATYASLDDPAVRPKLVQFENATISRVTFHVPVMHCSSCIWLLEHLHRLKEGIISSTVNFPRKEVTVDFQNDKVKLSEIAMLMADTGYPPAISMGDLELKKKKQRFSSRVLKIGVAGFCFGNIMLLSFPEYLSIRDMQELPQLRTFFGWLSLVLSLPVLFYSASGFFLSAWKAIRYRSLNIDAPIAIAVAITFVRSVYEITTGSGAGYLDSMSGIVFFMLIGRYFQDRTYENLSFDRDYRSYFPIAVTALRNGKEESVPVTNLRKGDRIVIRSGELVPADATLLSENAAIDYSFVSGEAEPVSKKKGDHIYAGARQTTGAIELEVAKETSQSYLTQLWNNDTFAKKLEEDEKSYVDKINRWFTTGVLVVAAVAAAAWFFIDRHISLDAFTAVLIVSCPCTLLLGATFTNGSILRWLGRKKFYLKNAGTIERLSTADTIVFDKTGTITAAGDAGIHFEGAPLNEEEIKNVAALVSQSGHPLSRKIAAALVKKRNLPPVRNVREVNGKGIAATIGGEDYLVGSSSFTGATGGNKNATEVWLAVNGKVRGKFVVRHNYRDGLENVLSRLREHYRIELLSGDNDAERTTLEPLFGNAMQFEQTPQAKLEHIRRLQQEGTKVIMIGDGLNDAGALMQADAGIAVSDSMNNFFPACDAILDGETFSLLPSLLSFTRTAKRVIFAGFSISLVYNITGIFFAVRGELSPMIAAILMPASSLTVILLTTLSVRLAALRLQRKKAM